MRGVALAASELPVALAEGLADRVHDRGGETELRFPWRAVPALLPVWWDGKLRVVRWGTRQPFIGIGHLLMTTAVLAYLGLVAVTSVASFAAYGLDKRRAAVGGRRVPERTLHLLAALGGWPGALLGQRQFRHKTKKVSFLIVFWAVVVLRVAVVGAVAYTLLGSSPTEAVESSRPISQG